MRKSLLIWGRLGTYNTWRSRLFGLSSVIPAYIFLEPAWLSDLYCSCDGHITSSVYLSEPIPSHRMLLRQDTMRPSVFSQAMNNARTLHRGELNVEK